MRLNERIVPTIQRWVDQFVVQLNLCPFAQQVVENGRLRYTVFDLTDEADLLLALQQELLLLLEQPEIETSLIIHPRVLTDFQAFNQFLDACDELLVQLKLEGVLQIASFHPDYQFAGTVIDDAENYSNRSPYPMLHILREASVEQAVAGHIDVGKVPDQNRATLNKIGSTKLNKMWQACFKVE